MRSQRLLVSLVLSAFTLISCGGDAAVVPTVSPVGRYDLVGCTWGGDIVAAHMKPGCGTGGSNRYDWKSGFVIVNADRTVSRTLVVTESAPFDPMQWSVTDTGVVVGRWTLDGRVLRAAWTGFPSAATTDFTRVGTDLIRENSVWNEWIYFWYRRTR